MVASFLLAPLFAVAHASPADWTLYLCKYGDDGTTRLVKVNERESRVLWYDRDADKVAIRAGSISFTVRAGGGSAVWAIKKPSLSLQVLSLPPDRPVFFEYGSCRVVTD